MVRTAIGINKKEHQNQDLQKQTPTVFTLVSVRKTSLSRGRWVGQDLCNQGKMEFQGEKWRDVVLLWVAGLLQVTQSVDNATEADKAFLDPDKRFFRQVYSFVLLEP